MSKRLSILSVLVFVVSVTTIAQTDCEQQFRRALDKVKAMRKVSEKDGMDMNCQIVITGLKGDVKRETMDVTMRGNKYKYASEKFNMYQDDKAMVVIQHEQKMVFITKPMPETLRTNQFAEMTALQDSLQRYMTLSSCEREFGTVDPKTGYIKMVFLPGKKIAGAGLKSVTYWINASTDEIGKIAIEYTGESIYGIRKYEMIVKKMFLNFSGSPFQGQAVAMAMKDNKLRDELKGYKVLDKRKTTR